MSEKKYLYKEASERDWREVEEFFSRKISVLFVRIFLRAIYFSFAIRERRAFLRLAVFFLITPFFAALSIALYAAEREVFASFQFFATTSFSIDLTPSLRIFLVRVLIAFFFSDTRSAFLAFLVIGIVAKL